MSASKNRKRKLDLGTSDNTIPFRNCDQLYAIAATVNCNCVPCAYKIGNFDVALDTSFCRAVPNQRPEQCPRSGEKGRPQVRVPPAMYGPQTRILTVGDGDFSFSLAVARLGCPVVATSYETKETVRNVYKSVHVDSTLRELRDLKADCAYTVDATMMGDTLPSYCEKSSFQRIVWNFPCSAVSRGQDGQNEEMEHNKSLIRNFVRSCKEFLTPDGQIHINHKSKPPFNQWNIEDVVQQEGMRYLGRIVLDRHLLPPYVPRKALDRKSFPCHDACTFIFGMDTTTTASNELRAIMRPSPLIEEHGSSCNIVAITPATISLIRLRHLSREKYLRKRKEV